MTEITDLSSISDYDKQWHTDYGHKDCVVCDQARAAETRPTIVCLCGSTRFSEAYRAANLRETLAGRIVLSIGCDFKSDEALGLTEADKVRMDELHLQKIRLADEVLILDVGGYVGDYVGDSTRRELRFAELWGKKVRYLSVEEIL